MALQEDKIVMLRQHDNWWSFTDPQRKWLVAMAEGCDPLEATTKAYPDCKNPVPMTKSMLSRVGIQSALESIGINKNRPNVTKEEALKFLSRFMRLASDGTEYCKLLALYGKLSGWNGDEDPKNPEAETSLDELVAAMEKKRKNAKAEDKSK